MEETIRLGRIRGIPVGVNWSLIVVFGLVVAGLAASRLPAAFPGYQPAVYVVTGAVTAALFFVSILAHELGHALVARRKGVPVEGITLWLFGGVAKFERDVATPSDELRIAGVGPAVSVAAGVVFGVAAALLDVTGAADIAAGALSWLAIINLVLALFNLIPAAPLDGGRILRALLWRRHGDRRRAAVTAGKAGHVFGLTLVALGIVEFAFGAGLGGIWFLLLGWFLITAARAEQTTARLQGIRVRDVMSPDPVVAPDWLTVADFLDDYVFRHRFSTFPVQDFRGNLSGVVTLRAVKAVSADRRSQVRLREIRCPLDRVPTIGPDEDLSDLLPRMAGSCSDGRALVLEEGRIVGVISPVDVARVADLADLRGARREPHVS